MDARALRGWLLCQPRPSSLRILDDKGETKTLAIAPNTVWSHLAESCIAMHFELIEALNATGEVIRAIRPEDDEEEEEAEEGFAVPTDGESQRLIVFAKLLADAYKHANDVAFAKLADLFDAVTRRSEANEKALVALHRILATKLAEGDGEGGGLGGQSFEQTMLAAFLQGQAQTAAKAAAAKAANGAAAPTTTEATS